VVKAVSRRFRRNESQYLIDLGIDFDPTDCDLIVLFFEPCPLDNTRIYFETDLMNNPSDNRFRDASRTVRSAKLKSSLLSFRLELCVWIEGWMQRPILTVLGTQL
jgi:hypothetical protein